MRRMERFLSGVMAVVALVPTAAGCDSKPKPFNDAIGSASLIILLDPVSRRVTVRNTGESKLVNCMVGVDKPSARGGIGVANPPDGTTENHTALADSSRSEEIGLR